MIICCGRAAQGQSESGFRFGVPFVRRLPLVYSYELDVCESFPDDPHAPIAPDSGAPTSGRRDPPPRCATRAPFVCPARAQGAPAVAKRFDSQQLFARRASRAPRGLAPHLFKINVQTSTYGPNRPQRHRRFYLAIKLAIKLDRLAEPMPDTSQARQGSRCARPAPPACGLDWPAPVRLLAAKRSRLRVPTPTPAC